MRGPGRDELGYKWMKWWSHLASRTFTLREKRVFGEHRNRQQSGETASIGTTTRLPGA